MTKTVIIGGVAAGASCAARLRRLDESAEIVMLEKGPYVSFANCGLPYFVGGVIRDRSDLSVQTPELLRSRFRIDVRTESEALSIDRAAKTVRVRGADGKEYDESYDRLVIATGASPIVPDIPGIRLKRVKTLTTVDDAAGLRSLVSVHRFMSAAVIGGGFIGLEAAENLREAGCSVTLIEASPQIMPPLDPEMAEVLTGELRRNGVELLTGTVAEEFQETEDGGLLIRLSGGRTVEADLAVLAIGVRPNSAIARDAGLEIGKTGGIAVSPELVTSDPDIYAAGDVIEVTDFISGEKARIPLAGPANKQGRIAANNIALGRHERYKGTQGTSAAKVFGLTAASTGSSEKALVKQGLLKGRDYESVIISAGSHAGYYPGSSDMFIKLLFAPDGSRIFGAEIAGGAGVDKRIDVIAAAIRLHAGVRDLAELELAYAPPYSSAKDPVNMAGFTASNVIDSHVSFADWDELEKHPEHTVLDVREKGELAEFSFRGAVHIPFGSIRERVMELNPSKTFIVMCRGGVRAYDSARILQQKGYKVKVYPGGTLFYRAVHHV